MKKFTDNTARRHSVAVDGFRPIQPSTAIQVAPAIIEGIRSMLAATMMDRARIERIVAAIEGRAEIVSPEVAERTAAPAPVEAVYKREELAKLLKIGIRGVDYHFRAGHLKAVYLPNSTRAHGFTAESVRALLNGGYAKTEAKRTAAKKAARGKAVTE